jgi:hypothetical protein
MLILEEFLRCVMVRDDFTLDSTSLVLLGANRFTIVKKVTS